MDKTAAAKRIAQLTKEINHHRYLYHVLDKQEISDAALDSLKKELKDLEELYPDLRLADSPTRRVSGRVLDKFKKVKHTTPILSLEDAFARADLEAWEKRLQKLSRGATWDYFVEAKLDGLTAVLRYEKGVLVRGLTRGDGKFGEDITQNLRTIQSVPLQLTSTVEKSEKKIVIPEVLEVRGEVLLTKEQFAKLNVAQKKSGQPLFANPRNVAAGSVRQLDPNITAARRLLFVAYEIMNDVGQVTHQEVHQMLKQFGFRVNDWSRPCPDLAAVWKYISAWENKRKQLPVETDGMVVVINPVAHQRRLGSVGKAQRWMIAYKFKAEEAETVVEDIYVQVGRMGTLTPVAKLRPVAVAGSVVSRATLHNEDFIKTLGLRIGDTVIIHKSGDIIPEVVSVLSRLRPDNAKIFRMPKQCPICRAAVVRVRGESAHRCTNKNCWARQRERLIHFVSKKGFNIDGVGPRIIDQLITNDLLHDAADLFDLTVGDLQPLERFAEKSAQNIVTAIKNSTTIELPSFLTALGIRYVGEETTVLLAEALSAAGKKVTTVASVAKALSAWTQADLEKINGIGPKVAASIYKFWHDPAEKKIMAELADKGIRIKPYQAVTGGSLAGKNFVLTGEMKDWTREEAKTEIKKRGGAVVAAVSKNTDFVVAGANPGSKYDKAKKLGLKIINEVEFKKLLS
jgi:DNA ligase (NAD+)